MNTALLVTLAWRFLLMAFLAIGGANAVVPEMHRQVVEVEHWMTDGEFSALFAIANAAPGPNVLIVTLVGWQVAGIVGALVATGAMIGPTSVLAYAVFHLWNRFRNAPWRRPIQNGLSSLTVGLIAASGYLLARAADADWLTAAITAVTVLVSVRSRLNPLWPLAGAGVIGAFAVR